MIRRVVTLASCALLAALACGAELVARRQAMFVEREQVDEFKRLGWVDQNPELLFEFTPDGKRLIPSVSVVIRNHQLTKLDVTIRTNAAGFRGAELAATKPSDETRILALGDSITWQDYLPEEETWVSQLEKRLNAQTLKPGRTWRVINGGVGDVGLADELSLLEQRGLAVEPDLVLLAFYLNDGRPSWGFPAELRSRGWLRRHSVLAEDLYRRLKLKRWMDRNGEDRFEWYKARRSLNWRSDPEAFNALIRAARFDWGSAWSDETWSMLDAKLRTLASLSKKHGFKVLIAAFPNIYQIEATPIHDEPQKRLAALASHYEFGFVDLLPVFREGKNDGFLLDECHPGALGSQRVAAKLASFLVR